MINTPAIFRRLSNGFTLPSRGMLAAWDMTVHNNVNILPVGADTYATSGGWATFDSSTITITPGQLDPNGTTSAYRVQCSAGGGTVTTKYYVRSNVIAGESITTSIWAKGTGYIYIITNSGVGSAYALTSTWQKFTLSYTAGAGNNSGFLIQSLAVGSAADVYLFQPYVCYGSTQTDYTPPQGYAIQTFHNEAENNLTNIVDYSESPTNAVWEIGSYGITKTATTGKSNIAGDAIRLQFTGGTTPNPNSYLLQTLVTTGTSIGDQYCFGAWIYSATNETLWVGANAIQISTSYSIAELAGDYGILNVTSGWHFYKWRTIAQTTANALAVQFNITSPFMSTDSFDIKVWHPQANFGKDLKPYIKSTDGLNGDLALMRGSAVGSDTNDFDLTGIGMVYGSDDVGKTTFPTPSTQHRTVIAVANFTDVNTYQYLLDHLGCELTITGGYLKGPTGAVQAVSPITTGWHVIFAVRDDSNMRVWVDGIEGTAANGSMTSLGTAAAIGNRADYTLPLKNRLMFMCVYDRPLAAYELDKIKTKIDAGLAAIDITISDYVPPYMIYRPKLPLASLTIGSSDLVAGFDDGYSSTHNVPTYAVTGFAKLIVNSQGGGYSSHIQSSIPDFIGSITSTATSALPVMYGPSLSNFPSGWWYSFGTPIILGTPTGDFDFRVTLDREYYPVASLTGTTGGTGTQLSFFGRCLGYKSSDTAAYAVGYGAGASEDSEFESFVFAPPASNCSNGNFPKAVLEPVSGGNVFEGATGEEVMIGITRTSSTLVLKVYNADGTTALATTGTTVSTTGAIYLSDMRALCPAKDIWVDPSWFPQYNSGIGVAPPSGEGYPHSGTWVGSTPDETAGGTWNTATIGTVWGAGGWNAGPFDLNTARDNFPHAAGATITGTSLQGEYPLEWTSSATTSLTGTWSSTLSATDAKRYFWFRQRLNYEASSFTTINRFNNYQHVNVPKHGKYFDLSILTDGWSTHGEPEVEAMPTERATMMEDELISIVWGTS